MPININDTFARRNNIQVPLTELDDVESAFLSVADITSRDNIAAFQRSPLMIVRVKDAGSGDTKFYELQPDLTTWTEDSAFGSGSFIETSEKGAANGVAPLNADGKIEEQYLNSLFINSTVGVADIAAMLAITSTTGDVFVVEDASADPNVPSGSAVYYKINNDDPADLADFLRLDFGAQVLSVNGKTGVVTITASELIDADLSAFNTRVSGSSFGTTTTASIAQNVIDIAQNAADIQTLFGSISEQITEFSDAIEYSVGDLAYDQDGAKNRELFISILSNPVTSVGPYDGSGSTYWEKIGEYYTKDEITSLLASKADLVGGVLDVTQLPSTVLLTSDLETVLTDDASKIASSKGARDYADAAADAAESAAIAYVDANFDTSTEVDSKISSAVSNASQGISGEFSDLTARDAASNISNGERWSVLSEGKVYEFTGVLGQSGASFWDFVYTLGGSGGGPAVPVTYPTWANLLADQANQVSGSLYCAVDASGFSTVTSGYAYFEYLGTTLGTEADYRKLSEEESLDVTSAVWGNISGTLADQTDLQSELDAKADKATGHTTGNLAELDASGNSVDSGTPIEQVFKVSDVDVSDINEGEFKIPLVQKSGGVPVIQGSSELIDKLATSSVLSLLGDNASWGNVTGRSGDFIKLTGDNSTGQLGENSQELYDDEGQYFLCISHILDVAGEATWVRNRSRDSLRIGVTQDDAVIAALENETGWNTTTNVKILTVRSKPGSWHKSDVTGYLYHCYRENDSNSDDIPDQWYWYRSGLPATEPMQILNTGNLTALVTALKAHDFTSSDYDPSVLVAPNEQGVQGQKYYDVGNRELYECVYDEVNAKIIWIKY